MITLFSRVSTLTFQLFPSWTSPPPASQITLSSTPWQFWNPHPLHCTYSHLKLDHRNILCCFLPKAPSLLITFISTFLRHHCFLSYAPPKACSLHRPAPSCAHTMPTGARPTQTLSQPPELPAAGPRPRPAAERGQKILSPLGAGCGIRGCSLHV